jgi:predicted GTPase
MNNYQNAIFHQLDNFMKHSHSFAMTIFHKITKSAKLVILLIIHGHQPPPVKGRRLKVKYVNQTDVFPPTLTFHGNHLQSRARTHAILVIGLYELLGNPST